MKIADFEYVALCSLVDVYRHFRIACKHLLVRRDIPEDSHRQSV